VKSLLLLLLAAVTAAAQSSNSVLSGTVADETGAMIAEARLELSDAAKGVKREVVTNGSGEFVLPALFPSTYELLISKDGFANTRISGMVLNAGDQRSIRITLKVAPRGEAVTVTTGVPLISVAPAVSTSVDRAFIENQPLNGRSFQTLIALSPGVVAAPASIVDQGQFSVNGQRTGANYFTVDGVSANFGLPAATSPYEGAGGGVPSFSTQGGTSALASVDAVQEFTIQTSTYAPEYGRQPGAQVAIVTRSGNNQFHGSVFEYFRNDKLDANSWFGNANRLRRPALRQNDFGGTLGGSIRVPGVYDGRDKTFFFFSYEGLRLRQPVISNPSRVPSLEARANATGVLKNILEAYPLPVAAPLADAPAETPYITSFSNPSSLDATSLRLDHSLSSNLTVFGRYNFAPSENRERGRFATPSFVAALPGRTRTATAGSTMILSPVVSNDLRVNWSQSYAAQIYEQDTFGGAKLLTNDLLFPSFADPKTSLFYLTIGGNDENTISPGTFSRNTQNQFNLVDTLSWNAGSHGLKFGFDYRRLAPSIGGRFFSKILTVPTITQLVTGIIPTADVRQVGQYLEPRYHNISVFGQDSWRITSRFTLTYGLRWEVNPAPGGDANTQPLTVRGLSNPPAATVAPRGEKLYSTTYANFAPRLGIAWQPFRTRDTVVRAGFGMFYDLGYAFAGTALSPSNYPYSRSRTLTNVPFTEPLLFAETPPLTLSAPYPRLFAYADDYKLPYTLQYSLAIEQPLGRDNSFSISYVGSNGRRLPSIESLRSQVLQNPSFTRIDYVSNGASSNYNALQLQLKRRMARGFQAMLAYTWAKSLDTASDESITNLQAPSVRVDPASNRGPSSFDIRHVFTGSASYAIPSLFRGGIGRSIFSGFALDSVVRLRTAAPVNLVTGRDPLGLGLTNVARPDVLAGVPLYLEGPQYAGGKRFNPAAFNSASPLAEGRQGTLGRNVLRGFGLSQVDLSLRRQFHLRERLALEVRADSFNLFNAANFANPTGTLTSTNFGIATQLLSTGLGGQNALFQVGGPRSHQLSLKLQF
jgi:hypothetical protein